MANSRGKSAGMDGDDGRPGIHCLLRLELLVERLMWFAAAGICLLAPAEWAWMKKGILPWPITMSSSRNPLKASLYRSNIQ